jgi:hypothetical protein
MEGKTPGAILRNPCQAQERLFGACFNLGHCSARVALILSSPTRIFKVKIDVRVLSSIKRIISLRHYHVDVARFAAKADDKWVDNLLSHFDVPGVERARQGLSRRISADGIYHIALIRVLNRDVGLSTSAAVSLAARLLASNVHRVALAQGLDVELDADGLRAEIDAAIAEGVESLAPARRGRPPRSSPTE